MLNSTSNSLVIYDVAIILPAYNEALTIEATIRAFHEAFPSAHIVVVDNASQDETARLAEVTLSYLSCTGQVLYESSPGKGNAMRRAFMDVEASIYVMSDADLTYPAHQITHLIAPILAGHADMVVGDRHSGGEYAKENKRSGHLLGNHLVQQLVNRLFGSQLVDIMSGYRAFTRQFVKNYPVLVEGFEIETDLTLFALQHRFRIVELPIAYQDRPAGSYSKLSTYSDGMRVLLTIANIFRYYKPLVFFSGLALIFFTVGLLAGYPVVDEFLATGYVKRVPLAILATGLELMSFLSLAIGLVLDAIVHQSLFNFEKDLLRRN